MRKTRSQKLIVSERRKKQPERNDILRCMFTYDILNPKAQGIRVSTVPSGLNSIHHVCKHHLAYCVEAAESADRMLEKKIERQESAK